MLKQESKAAFYLFTAGVFLIIYSPALLSDGMFMDGLIYSVVARNLAMGDGSFWNLSFSSIYFNSFHEHPPLAMGVHSIFYSVFGDSRFVDKLFSIATYVITAFLIHRIWHLFRLSHSWIPLLMWLSIPLTGWACSNNMLENTLSILICAATWLYFKGRETKPWLFCAGAGIVLFLGVLTKGPVALFPWTLPFIALVTGQQQKIGTAVQETICMVVGTLLPLALLLLLSDAAYQSLEAYVNIQVVNSLKNIVTVDSRWFIVKKLLLELIPVFALVLIALFIGRKQRFVFHRLQEKKKQALMLVLVGLSGVIPIMVSMKQNGFYILPALPFFAMGVAVFIYPLSSYLLAKVNYNGKAYRRFHLFGSVLLLAGITLSLAQANTVGRDKVKLADLRQVFTVVPKNEIINVHPDLWTDWSLHGYLQRYHRVSMDNDLSNQRQYLLMKADNAMQSTAAVYIPVDLPLKDFQLYMKSVR